jgi:PAS domain S-box-containing protein
MPEKSAHSLPVDDVTSGERPPGALRESEERLASAVTTANQRLSAILESAGDVIAMMDLAHRYTLFNTAFHDEFERIFGADLKPGDSMLETLAHLPGDLAKALVDWDRALAGEDFTVTQEFGDPRLQRRWYELRFSPIRDAFGRVSGAVHVVRDITARRAVERALAESEVRFRSMADSAPVLIWTSGTDALCDYFNAPWLAFTGRTLAQEIGNGWAEGVHPDDFQRCLDVYLTSFRAQRPFTMEYRLRHADGTWRWILDNGIPRVAPDGAFAGYIGSCIDISPIKEVQRQLHERQAQLGRKQAELEELNRSLEARVAATVAELRAKDQLLFTQSRHAAMGQMIGNIAHQWRQPLNVLGLVLGNLQDAAKYEELDVPAVVEAVAEGKVLIQTMSSTINDFRDYFHPQTEKTTFSALAQVRETLKLLEASFHSEGVDLEVEVSSDQTVSGFSNEYSQVLLNLLSNAREAILAAEVARGQVRIWVGERDGLGCVTIRDNGGGVPIGAMDRLFEPYFSTKEGGTGIGLYMSRQIIERNMGGRLEVKNVEGGAEVSVLVPLSGSRAGSG